MTKFSHILSAITLVSSLVISGCPGTDNNTTQDSAVDVGLDSSDSDVYSPETISETDTHADTDSAIDPDVTDVSTPNDSDTLIDSDITIDTSDTPDVTDISDVADTSDAIDTSDASDTSDTIDVGPIPSTGKIVNGYYVAWNIDGMPSLNVDEIDWTNLTHITLFCLHSETTPRDQMNVASIAPALVAEAHKHNVKALISMGYYFPKVTTKTDRAELINYLVDYKSSLNFDGIAIDWEEIDTLSYAPVFMKELRAALQPSDTLILSLGSDEGKASVAAAAQNYVDVIETMTYYFSNNYNETSLPIWFNSALYSRPYPKAPSILLQSVDNTTSTFIKYGVKPNKLSVGIAFTGHTWTGNYSSDTPPQPNMKPGDYYNLPGPNTEADVYLAKLLSLSSNSTEVWDDVVKNSYWQINDSDPMKQQVLFYETQRSIKEKCKYIQNKNLAGSFIWQLKAGQLFDGTNPLLESMSDCK